MIWREARGEGMEGMRAVAHVAKNRATKDDRPIYDVIVQDAQFTSINPPRDTHDKTTDDWPALSSFTFGHAYQIAFEVYYGIDPDNTNGAYFYANLKYITPNGDFQRNIIPNYPKVAEIGAHTFYSGDKIKKV